MSCERRGGPDPDGDGVRAYFSELSGAHGRSARAVGWSPAAQSRRFEVLSSIGRLDGASVLDAGCGCGHLFDYVIANAVHADYTGIDYTPALIAAARTAHPQAAHRFVEGDLFTMDLPVHDYAIANGLINAMRADPYATLVRLLRRLYDACAVGFALTVTSTRADVHDEGVHYYDPEIVLREVMRLTRYVRLDHTYLPHDVAVFGYRSRPESFVRPWR